MFNTNNEWQPEDDSVVKKVAEITAQDSPLMRQATAMGTRQANRRGLLNSSIAGGAARREQLAVAAPLASQDAQQIGAKNLARIQGDYGMSQSRMQIASQERDSAAARLSDAFRGYNESQSALAGNNKIKAGTRSAMQRSNLDVLNSQLSAFRNLYPSANLNWGTAT